MIDSHCHIDFPLFDRDRQLVLDNARKAGVTGFLIPCTQARSLNKIIDIAGQFPDIYFSVGLHPYFLKQSDVCNTTEFKSLVDVALRSSVSTKMLAIGEIGLDFHIATSHEIQIQVFTMQLNVAKELRLPVILHHRKSHNDLIRILKKNNFPYGGVLHAFSGSTEDAKQYIDLGFKLGVGGTITYDRSAKSRRAIKSVGIGHLLLETDSPDMPLSGFQGQRNTPERLPIVMSCLSQLLEISEEEVVTTTSRNFKQVFAQNVL